MDLPSPLFRLFSSFQTNITNFTTIKSCIQCWDSNPRLLNMSHLPLPLDKGFRPLWPKICSAINIGRRQTGSDVIGGFVLKMGHSRPHFLIFIFSRVNSKYVRYKKFADDCIRIADLSHRKWPLCQLSHNYCPWRICLSEQNFLPKKPHWTEFFPFTKYFFPLLYAMKCFLLLLQIGMSCNFLNLFVLILIQLKFS